MMFALRAPNRRLSSVDTYLMSPNWASSSTHNNSINQAIACPHRSRMCSITRSHLTFIIIAKFHRCGPNTFRLPRITTAV